MRLILYTIVVIYCSSTTAQIKFDVKVSEKHLKKVEQSKDAREKLKSYKHYYQKDSIKAAKKEWKHYKQQHKDSLKSAGLWKEAKANRQKILKDEWKPYEDKIKKYKVDLSNWPDPKDSLDWALRELALQEEWNEVEKVYKEYGHYDSTYLDQFQLDSAEVLKSAGLDTAALKRQYLDSAELVRRFKVKERIGSYMPEELQQEADLDIAQQMKNGVIDQYGDIQKVDKSGVAEFFKNVDPQEFAKSQLTLDKLKKKYASLPNLEKKEEGIRKNSLEDTPWKKRIYLGGYFTIQSTDPIIIDSDIRVGYELNKKWSVGMGFILREQFGSNDSTALAGDTYGYSVFTTYDILKSFFVTTEYQAQREVIQAGDSHTPIWQRAYMAGIGREFSFSEKVSATVSLLYDFNFKANNLNARPLVFRFGYKVGF